MGWVLGRVALASRVPTVVSRHAARHLSEDSFVDPGRRYPAKASTKLVDVYAWG